MKGGEESPVLFIFMCRIIATSCLIICKQSDLNHLLTHFRAQFSNIYLSENVLCFRCTDEYGGRDCSIYYGQQSPCYNYCNQNGRCSLISRGSELSNPVCSCYPGWTGPRCKEKSSSACKGYCFNGGTCQESSDPSLKPSCM